jgi:hypothetical protein
MKRNFFLIILALILGCTHTYEVTKTSQTSNAKLDKNAKAYVSVPEDGRYGDILYEGSGSTTAQAIQKAFAKHLSIIERGKRPEIYKDALNSAQNGGFNYLIYPMITHWEDRATEWSGLSDKISVKLSIIDAQNDSTIDSVIINGKSRWGTFGGDHPQDLLHEPIEKYVDSLFE